MITLTLPNGAQLEVEKGSTCAKATEKIGKRLANDALAAKLDGVLVDLARPIETNARFEVLTYNQPEGVEIFRHSAAHLLAQAIMRTFPQSKLTIGPPTDEGFYYDIDSPKPFTPDDLLKIETEMQKVVEADFKATRHVISPKKAKELFKDNPYKVELVDDAEGEVSYYEQGEFKDLCRGPHVPSTGYLKAFKLTKISGAYWRADAKNKQLQRVYGVVFPEKKLLDKYLFMLKEAEKRDHRKLGKELDLYHIHEEGPGFIFWHPKGMRIIEKIKQLIREQNKARGYGEISTPTILHRSLWERSGHYGNFKENMYFVDIDAQQFAVKPMNCPGACLTYTTKKRSYRDLPLRFSEFGYVHRHELAGVVSGLVRVRAFTQDDSHTFCTPDQLAAEVTRTIEYAEHIYRVFGFTDYEIFVATRPEKSVGTDKQWEQGIQILKEELEKKALPFGIKEGEGAFYGPKIEYNIKDSLGRNWQIGTIQIDYSMPDRFDLTYVGADGADTNRPVMIHKAIVGSIERFMGILIEHFAGKFPLWLSPEPIRILPVADRFIEVAKKAQSEMEKEGIDATIDSRSESIPYKVRDAQLSKVNYILVVGEREAGDGTVTVRTRDGKVLGALRINDFIEKIKKELANKEINA